MRDFNGAEFLQRLADLAKTGKIRCTPCGSDAKGTYEARISWEFPNTEFDDLIRLVEKCEEFEAQ